MTLSKTQTIILSIASFLLITLIITLGSSCTSIQPGHRGVVIELNAVNTETVLGEGWTFVTPFITRVEQIDVRTKRFDINPTSAGTNDMQEVGVAVTVNYRVNPQLVSVLYQRVGVDYESVIIERAGVETIKSTCSKYRAEDLIKQRRQVSADMEQEFIEKLNSVNGLPQDTFIVDEFSITDFTFSRAYMNAVEAKQIAEQEAAQARNQVEREIARADQAIEAARGQAEALRQQAEVLKENPVLIYMEMARKWDGRMPLVVGDEGGFLIDLETLRKLKEENTSR